MFLHVIVQKNQLHLNSVIYFTQLLKTTSKETQTCPSLPFCCFFTAPEGQCLAQKFPQVLNTLHVSQTLPRAGNTTLPAETNRMRPE